MAQARPRGDRAAGLPGPGDAGEPASTGPSAIRALEASTLHRLLGCRPDNRTRFRHDRGNRLPHDVVVVDETSMVSLTMMARLLEAVRPEARLVLVGDADQLASVEAGAVLKDLVDGYSAGQRPGAAACGPTRRFGQRIGELAEAVAATATAGTIARTAASPAPPTEVRRGWTPRPRCPACCAARPSRLRGRGRVR